MKEDLIWIEKFYSDFEAGMYAIGKIYVRPLDYVERATRILHGKRSPLLRQQDGKKGYYHEVN